MRYVGGSEQSRHTLHFTAMAVMASPCASLCSVVLGDRLSRAKATSVRTLQAFRPRAGTNANASTTAGLPEPRNTAIPPSHSPTGICRGACERRIKLQVCNSDVPPQQRFSFSTTNSHQHAEALQARAGGSTLSPPVSVGPHLSHAAEAPPVETACVGRLAGNGRPPRNLRGGAHG